MSVVRRRLKTLVGAGNVLYASGDTEVAQGIRRAAALARKAEAEKITGLFTADLLQADPAGLAGNTGSQEPIVALAALSQATSDIGLVATVSTTYHHPYNIARLIGTLDHVSGGRAAWNAVTSSVGEENFGEGALPDPERRYARATEFVEIVNALPTTRRPRAAQLRARCPSTRSSSALSAITVSISRCRGRSMCRRHRNAGPCCSRPASRRAG
ncbi:MAG: LLM class flavin-dependent oxidoreductase [Paraburkholderia sp.]